MTKKRFWKGKRVFLTGHTGFKGSWMSLWLSQLGAKVTGYALQPPTDPSLFKLCRIDQLVDSRIADIRDKEKLTKAIASAKPEIVIHMAAQPLVRRSYLEPAETFAINVTGTVNLFEAIRSVPGIKVVLNVTSDKCYLNNGQKKAFKEDSPLGGYDPYSSSKACSEIVTAAYRSSYFNQLGIAVATARAGNVIGGGDWAEDRLVPDFIRSILKNEPLNVRNPGAIRPWQHVLEPLNGYLMLIEKLYENGLDYAEAWNFGPEAKDAKPVEWIVNKLCQRWGSGSCNIDEGKHPHEAHYLKLDCSKAKARLKWRPKYDLNKALEKVIGWTRDYKDGRDVRQTCFAQIEEYDG